MSDQTIPQVIPIPNKFIKDIAGQRFGSLVVIGYVGSVKRGSKDCSLAQWLCVCDCGTSIIRIGAHLRSGHVNNCGCQTAEKLSRNGKKNRRHGMEGTPEYRAWGGMRARCRNPKHKSFARYGGRGIKVCEEWQTFEGFFSDMGPRPSADHSIDRIDNDGDYMPGNCRWATPQEQMNNYSRNHPVTWGDATHTIAEWEQITGINRDTLWSRIFKAGWVVERALTEPVDISKWTQDQRHRMGLINRKSDDYQD